MYEILKIYHHISGDTMNINIRENVLDNIKDENAASLIDTINESVNNEDEISLPGLGVLFELFWNNSDEKIRKDVVDNILKGLKK